jgi:hypothetical protein
MESYIPTIKEYCDIAQVLINELYKNDPKNETFEQAGIINGREIVNDYFSHGEPEIALEHLLYMIHESEITFPSKALKKLHLMAKEYGIKNSYLRNE